MAGKHTFPGNVNRPSFPEAVEKWPSLQLRNEIPRNEADIEGGHPPANVLYVGQAMTRNEGFHVSSTEH
jgi:hypothetical protein